MTLRFHGAPVPAAYFEPQLQRNVMRNAVALGSMLLVLAGRGYDSGSGPDGQAYTVAVSIASTDPMTAAGEIRLATAVVRDAYGSVISAPSVSWRTSAPAVATVAGSGASATVTAVDDGTASITAASGGVEGVITVTVRRSVVSIELSAPDSVVVAGSTTQLTVVGRDARGAAITGLTAFVSRPVIHSASRFRPADWSRRCSVPSHHMVPTVSTQWPMCWWTCRWRIRRTRTAR